MEANSGATAYSSSKLCSNFRPQMDRLREEVVDTHNQDWLRKANILIGMQCKYDANSDMNCLPLRQVNESEEMSACPFTLDHPSEVP